MAELPIIKLPDPLLKQPSAKIETVDASVLKLADDMIATMYKAVGVGLAAVQVGVLKRLVVIDVSDKDDVRLPQVFINPEIVKVGDMLSSYEEGCLSIPDCRVEIERPADVTVSYIDRDGKPQILAADGLLATALQHEIDHLNGKLIIDYMSRLRRDMVVRKLKKILRG